MKSSFLRIRHLRRSKSLPIQLSTRPQFPIDETLVERQIQEAQKLGPNSIKPLLTEPVAGPVNFEELPV